MTLAEAAVVYRQASKSGDQEAPASAQRCADENIIYLEHDPAADRQALLELAAKCHCYSPAVGIEESLEPSCIFLDVTGSAPRLGGEHQLVTMVGDDFLQRGYRMRSTVANTLGAAWAFAHFADPAQFAPFQLDHRQECWIIPPHECAGLLSPLPVEALRLADDVFNTLDALGVKHIGELLKLPRSGLAARFDPQLLTRLDQLLGNASEPIEVYEEPPPLVLEQALEHPTTRQAIILSWVTQLLDQLVHNLQQSGCGVLQLDCTLRTSKDAHTLHVGLYEPANNKNLLLSLLEMQLQQLQLSAAVCHITLHASLTDSRYQQQYALFDSGMTTRNMVHSADEDAASLTHLINRLSSRLGSQAVCGTGLQAEVLPEYGYWCKPLTGTRAHANPHLSRRHPNRRHRHFQGAGLRPLRLLPSPRPLSHVSLRDGRPTSFHDNHAQHKLRLAHGPERIETRFAQTSKQQGRLIQRDYFRVEDRHGQRFWIFCERQTSRWFLHGFF